MTLRPSPAALAGWLDGILAAAGPIVCAIPADRLRWTPPGADRTLADLGFQVFRLGLAFADGMDLGEVREGWLHEPAPPDLADGPAIARYGALVRGRLGGWLEGAAAGEYGRQIELPGGRASGHEVLERLTAAAARHLARLRAALDGLGVAGLATASAAEREGLTLPAWPW